MDLLNIPNFKSFKSKFQQTKLNSGNLLNQTDFTRIYNLFKSIYNGDVYKKLILDSNELYTFITSPKQQSMSFRIYIIDLCNKTYNKCYQTYNKIYPRYNYYNEYSKLYESVIVDTSQNEKYAVNDPWPEYISNTFLLYTNEQLIIIYQYVLLEHFATYSQETTITKPTNIEEEKVPENWDVEESKEGSDKQNSDDILLQLFFNNNQLYLDELIFFVPIIKLMKIYLENN